VTAVVLEARRVAHAFGASPVLDDVTLGLAAGELLALVGPNGAGKTTLLRVLAGVLRPREGEVRLRGEPLARIGRRALARELGVVPQELIVPFPYRVRELVAMGRAPWLGAFGRERAEDREVVEAALRALALEPLAERSYPTLSGGEKQRTSLARALAQEADVLLLDEPTAHMDLGHRLHTFEWLRGWIAARPVRRAAFVVTHDLVLAAQHADRIALLHGGRLAAVGAPREVLTPERLEAVYAVEARIEDDGAGHPLVVAVRSRIGYIAPPHEPDR
jgi:iron complex transport system ATP-binding protein